MSKNQCKDTYKGAQPCAPIGIGRYEGYAKLTGVVVWHWLVLVCRVGVWDWSLPMAACAFQKLFVGLGVQWAPGMEAPVRGTVVPSRAMV